MKLITPGVTDLIKSAPRTGKFPAATSSATRAWRPFHDFEDEVPADVKAELETVAAGLKDGSISTGYGVAPAEEPAATEGAPVATEEATPAPAPEKVLIDCTAYDLSGLKIGLVTDVGQVNDKSFNQSSWEACRQRRSVARRSTTSRRRTRPTTPTTSAEFAESDYNVIVTVGLCAGSGHD